MVIETTATSDTALAGKGTEFWQHRPIAATLRVWILVLLLAPAIGIASRAADRSDRDARLLYQGYCSACHGVSLQGGQFGPALKGSAFRSKWQGNRREAILAYISEKMPPANAGSLDSRSYEALATWIDAAQGASKSATANEPEPRHVGPVAADPRTFQDPTYQTEIARRRKLLDAITPVTREMLEAPPPEEWLLWRRTYDNISFSPLAQIDRTNAAALQSAWSWSLPAGANESTPMVHDGVMFVQSANEVQALDARDGTLLWRYVRRIQERYRGSLSMLHRNFALYGDRIFISTPDRHVVALAAKTGQLVWDHTVLQEDEAPGAILSSGPTVIQGILLQGTSAGPACKGGCIVVGLDPETGREIWRRHTIPAPGETGDDSWNGAPADDRFGGAVWVPPSFDPQTGLAYVGVGQTYAAQPLLHPPRHGRVSDNDGLFTDSTLAIDPASGQTVWYHQHFARDVWDLDEAFERALVTLPIGGSERRVLVNTGKLGILDMLDRQTGDYLLSKDLGLQDVVASIDPATGRRTTRPQAEPEADRPVSVCPSPEGARNWMSTAYNPGTRILYLPMEETCMDLVWQPRDKTPPAEKGSDFGWTVKPRPNADGNYARLEAINLETLQPLWVRRSRVPLSSSLLATAGGVLFSGSRDRMFIALDDRSGDVLWRTRLNGAPNSSPITYSIDGTQYVAVIAGTGGPHDSESMEITPEIDNGAPSTTLWVFTLPQTPAAAAHSHQ